MQIIVWDMEGPPPAHEKAQIILWRSYGEPDLPDAVSIPALIEENADSLHSRYLAWIYELGETRISGKRLIDYLELRAGFSYWWMTLIAEKCNFAKSPQITDAIRLFALMAWAKDKPIDDVELTSANKSVIECLYKWCEAADISYKWKFQSLSNKSRSLPKRIYNLLPLTIQALVWLVWYVVKSWPLRGIGVEEWKKSKGKMTFVSYLLNSTNEERFESQYWTQLPGKLADNGVKTNWLHIYIRDALIPDEKKAASIINQLNSGSGGVQTHVTLSGFLNFRVVVQTLQDWRYLCKVCADVDSILSDCPSSMNLWPLFKVDWHNSIHGHPAISNLIMFNLFESAFQLLDTQKKGVYLQENQGWEFGMIHAWKSKGHNDLFGFPHSTVRFWDFRYFFDSRSYVRTEINDLPLPDRVACNGKVSLELFENGEYPRDKIVQVESLRYLYLENKPYKASTLGVTKSRRLLVLGDYVPINTDKQLRLLEKAIALLQKEVMITLKPHPACPIIFSNYPKLNMTIGTAAIGELLEENDLVYTGMVTSAAVDAYCSGLNVITFLDGDQLNLSPLRGRVERGVTFVTTPQELAKSLECPQSYCNSGNVHNEEYFFLDSELPRWRHLLIDNFDEER